MSRAQKIDDALKPLCEGERRMAPPLLVSSCDVSGGVGRRFKAGDEFIDDPSARDRTNSSTIMICSAGLAILPPVWKLPTPRQNALIAEYKGAHSTMPRPHVGFCEHPEGDLKWVNLALYFFAHGACHRCAGPALLQALGGVPKKGRRRGRPLSCSCATLFSVVRKSGH